ncbi:MAG: benzoyl-CoA-dihydrodiol lyase [Rhodospirillaceae bacterium TMED8]|nr:benzoyl-CoA-dihydrodiol lyase [Magnetovibrio sp.]OUT48324.1 MAG: benzoyl-CoA-dihydrodiol lyase [Rhodospirillaceae bacterium TMED8]
MKIDFRTSPDVYRHWSLETEGCSAKLTLSVDPTGGIFPGYELKMNSYDLGVDIELADAVQRLRFEHPEVRVVVIQSGLDRIFCAGANIKMLGGSAHGHKVNFCKFTNETRNAIEDASMHSRQRYIAAINGTAAGGGYELALATDHIILIDDGSAAVSLPEVPLLGVLPGTGGLTRLVDKRKVRRDLADVFCAAEEGIRGEKAVEWRLVDEVVRGSEFSERVRACVWELIKNASVNDARGIIFDLLDRKEIDNGLTYKYLDVVFDRTRRLAELMISGPEIDIPENTSGMHAIGANFWPLALTRELDDALLYLRFNEPELGTLVFRSEGNGEKVLAFDMFLQSQEENWLGREILNYWKRTMKRLDITSRTLLAEVLPGSCFAGFLSEILFSVDRCYMLQGELEHDSRSPGKIWLSTLNFALFPMANGLSRLETRFLGEPENFVKAQELVGKPLDAESALSAGLVTVVLDDIDWEDEIRIVKEERASYSPDALIGMEANLRFAGPETIETKIFGRLSAWQNWIFQRENAIGDDGALKLYGTGFRPKYDKERV